MLLAFEPRTKLLSITRGRVRDGTFAKLMALRLFSLQKSKKGLKLEIALTLFQPPSFQLSQLFPHVFASTN